MPIAAAVLSCLIVGTTDGDTLTARCDAAAGQLEQTIRVRLAEIDAPEKAQPFGERSRQRLAQICFRQRAEVAPLPGSAGLDRYGRTVARVTCSGVDANADQVRAGMAWVFDRYARDLTLYDLQAAARRARVGLWADAEPVTPWQWRADRRAGRERP
ncbi:thermonuclease family protein [Rubrivivax gelatinosus]|uniref:Endonuclease YncB(Thermonuclease family) n=1 Tax=Rubrivivax gelatinosus TaxID=28068 RepID=A0A4R2M719_RUBGE|nr:thermonuclease family protein [Rubrivivax gelatinosus]MBK1688882.1 nuclease [Rubrivivax gelatinosus]TCP03079.1 endonuclease YncB(thermonuclease family) [Rubrivivax gelatinosus]